MINAHIEIAYRYADQILYGEILPATMLDYMIEIEDGFTSETSLFEKAGLTEEEGYLYLGRSREELYLHIVRSALQDIEKAPGNVAIVERAYARASKSLEKEMSYSDIRQLTEKLGIEHIERRETKKPEHRINLKILHGVLCELVADISNEENAKLAEKLFSSIYGLNVRITASNIDTHITKIEQELGKQDSSPTYGIELD